MNKQIYQQIMDKGTTIAEAKEQLRQVADKGFRCPCCNRFAKVYTRKITSAMAIGLIKMYRATVTVPAAQWIHLEDFFKSFPDLPSSIRGDVPKLRFWGFIEPRGEETEDGNPNSGFYRITSAGMKFVELGGTIHSHVRIYDNRFLGVSSKAKQINICEALTAKFNYVALMQA